MGPAGFAFLISEIESGRSKNHRYVVLEKGYSLVEGKLRPKGEVNFGMGGAGTFSDGKLVASTTVGGTLPHLTPDQYFGLADEALEMLERFKTGNEKIKYEWSEPDNYEIPLGSNLTWNKTKVCHIGTIESQAVVKKIEEFFRTQDNVEFLYGVTATKLTSRDDGLVEIEYKDEQHDGRTSVFIADRVITSAPGLGINQRTREVHLGFRTESKEFAKYEGLITSNYDFKLSMDFEKARARTFCACSDGAKVTPQLNGGVYASWNGHGLKDGTKDSVNYGVLVTYQTDKTQSQLNDLMREVNEAFPNSPYPVNELLNDQKFHDIFPVAGELKEFFKEMNYLIGITDEVAYVPEIEVIQKGVQVTPSYEMVDMKNVHVLGTASGYGRSVIQCMITGIQASRMGAEEDGNK